MSEARIHLDAQVQVRRDTEANWVAVDPVLRDGEIAYSRDINRIKIGDGAHKWSELEYMLSVDAPDYEDIDLSGYAKKEDVATLADHLASMWSLDDDGNLVTEKNVIIKKNLTIGGDTSTGGTGEDTGVSGTVTGIRVDANTVLGPTNGVVDMSDVLANLEVDVDLSDYYTKQETLAEIAEAIAGIDIPSLDGYAKLTDIPSLDGYATEEYVTDSITALNVGQYATKASLETLQGEVDNIEAVLGMDEEAAGIINTWNEVKAFLDGYSSSDDLATILSGMNADIAKRALDSDLDELALTVEDNTTNIRNLKDSVYTKEDLATYKSWWDDLMPLIVKEGNDIKIKTNLIVAGDTSSGGTGSNPEVAGTLIGIKVNGVTYNEPVDGILTIPDYPTSLEWSAINGKPTKVSEFFNDSGFITSAALVGYATQSWVEDKKYLTSHQSIYGLTIKDSAGGSQVHFNPAQEAKTLTLTKAMVGLGNVDNTADADKSVKYATSAGSATASDVYDWAKKSSLALADVPDLSSKYLSKAGGTFAYDFTLSSSYYSGGLQIQRLNANGAGIRFLNTTDGVIGHIGVGGSGSGDKLAFQPIFTTKGGSDKMMWHEGNFNPADYLPLSGGTISGISTAPLNIRSIVADVGIRFLYQDVNKAFVGYGPNVGAYLYNYDTGAYIGVDTSGTPYYHNGSYKDTLIHSGNSTSYNAGGLAHSNGTVGVVVNSSGNVTIGASDLAGTSVKLYVAGAVRIGVDNSISTTKGTGTLLIGADRHLAFDANDIQAKDKDGNPTELYINDWGGDIIFGGAGSGNVLIGTTTDDESGAKMQVDGGGITIKNGTAKNYSFIRSGNYSSNTSRLTIGTCYGYSTEKIGISVYNGCVGIGETATSGAYTLDVFGTARISGAVTMSSTLSVTSGVTSTRFLTNGNYGFWRGPHFSSSLTDNDVVIYGSNVCMAGVTRPHSDKTTSLGTSSYQWSAVYAVNAIFSGDTATGSDIRFKDKLSDHRIALSDIANAPLFTFKWNDREDDSVHLGSSAQYWEGVAPWLVKGTDFKALDYSTLGVAIGISLANKTLNHEERIKILENKIEALEAENRRLRYGS